MFGDSVCPMGRRAGRQSFNGSCILKVVFLFCVLGISGFSFSLLACTVFVCLAFKEKDR